MSNQPEHTPDLELLAALKKSIRYINDLCKTVNVLDRARGGNGRKVRKEDWTEEFCTVVAKAEGRA